ncbi:MAG: ABC transporter permease subunit [Actinomycetes bacterium]
MKNRILNLSRYVILAAGLLFFVFPVASAIEFSLRSYGNKGHTFANYSWIFQQEDFFTNITISLKLAALSAVITLLTVVPAVTYLHLEGQRFKRIFEFLAILPLVVPVVSLAIGAQKAMPTFIQNSQYELAFFYVVIAIPYTFQSLNVGLTSIPLKTLVEASRSLGASFGRTVISVIVPAIRSAINAAIFLAVTLSFGEFTLTSLLHWETFPVWITRVSQGNVLGSIALSMFSLIGAWTLLILVQSAQNVRKKKVSKSDVEESEEALI